MNRGRMQLAAAFSAAVFSVACGAADSSDDGATADTSFAAIRGTVFQPACTPACHAGGEFAAGGLDLSKDAYSALIDAPAMAAACKPTGMKRVVPGKPEQSLLYLKIQSKLDATDAPCGEVMPAGVDRPALSAADVARVRAWIEAGAPND